MSWRVVVDLDLCQGHGTCEGEAPEVFEVPRHGKVTIVQPEPPDALRGQVVAAVTYCPTHALRIVDDPTEPEETD